MIVTWSVRSVVYVLLSSIDSPSIDLLVPASRLHSCGTPLGPVSTRSTGCEVRTSSRVGSGDRGDKSDRIV